MLRNLRQSKGLSQKELGELLSFSESVIGAIENDKRSVSVKTLSAWCDICGYTLSITIEKL